MEHKLPLELRFAKSARKHRIGKARTKYAIENSRPEVEFHPEGEELTWVSRDDRGVELEIVGINTGNYILIIHVMPTNYRKRGRDGKKSN